MEQSELEKMQAGEWYTCLDDQLEVLRMHALEATHAHNHLPPSQRRGLSAPLQALFASHGEGCLIEVPFHCSYGMNITLGSGVFLNSGCVILDSAPVTIGDNTLIGPGAQIYCAQHHKVVEQRRAGIEIAYPVAIGQDVWIGGGAIIMPGVTIGDRAIVGAGSVVTRDVPSGATFVGNPARAVG
ncbi:sugar O-acetyltransferase [Thalassococcus sp. S3]|uniref:sugar O-acetyltransferase n=1 Tax=Thalassococcus sp. S3 TaxID=2017482 RepID=UPI00102453B2|nr:sugar O-acetyltransferase [Thalassococcus sp. S3]QBF31589.1 maltose acetyltransferase [Thalassococcus sp. S3]